MDFRFTEEQIMTAEAVRGLLADCCGSADLRRLIAAGETLDHERAANLDALGLAGALVPEAAGGLGLGAADFVLVAEAAGHALLPEPLVETAGVALPLYAAFASGDARVAGHLARALAGGATLAIAHPVNAFVADAGMAAAILAFHDGEAHLVEPAAARLAPQASVDPFRRLAALDFDPAPATRVAAGAAAASAFAAALDRGALFAAAQLAGIAERAIELAVAYAGTRTQFGRPIGTNQAVKHRLADARVALEFARPVLYAAAADLEHGDLHARARVSQAKLAATAAADLAVRAAIQVHGAMGYSWEVDLHLHLKRVLALTEWWGGPRFHRERVAARVFGAPLGPDQTFAREQRHA